MTWARLLPLVTLLLLPAAASAQGQRYAVVIAGAGGGAPYAEQYARWTDALADVLVHRLAVDASHVFLLSDTSDRERASSASNVRALFGRLAGQIRPRDLLFVILIGHGTFDGIDAKFNLVGPDLESAEWASLLDGLSGRLVLVNTSSASFPFIERLSRPGRIVISATDSAAQRFDTVFPEYFIAAFGDEEADIDKNGRVSIWEAFAAGASGVRRHYQARGQLATERALLDDNGDGIGREAAAQGDDGGLASRTYLDPEIAGAPPTDGVLVELLHRRASLLAEVEELQIKKAFMSPSEYAREFERLMIALAKVTRDAKARAGS